MQERPVDQSDNWHSGAWNPLPAPYDYKVNQRHPNTMSIYTDNGYANRKEYLNALREDYGDLVNILTSVLPASEDFDGLVTALEDAMDSGEYDDLM